jgi:FAD synthase
MDKPLVISGEVITGFQRGGKLLGCPTANIDIDSQGITLDDSVNGIYFGWAVSDLIVFVIWSALRRE